MVIIVGLGNPGKEYEKTRHNAGFLYVDFLQTQLQFPRFQLDKHFQAEISRGKWLEQDVVLVKPQTFMNLSGQTVLAIQQFYKLASEDFWIVYDEMDLPLGKLRVRKEGSSAGHNGIKSIMAALATEKFTRFRIGVKPEHYIAGMEKQSIVLGRFGASEEETLFQVFTQAEEEMRKEILEAK